MTEPDEVWKERCEVCSKPIDARCAGLDTPELGFCAKHAKEHEQSCRAVRDGTSQIHWLARGEEA